MRILILLPTVPFPPDTGQKHRYAYLARYLARHHEVSLAMFRQELDAPQISSDDGNFVASETVYEAGPDSVGAQWFGREPSDVTRFRSDEMQASIARLVERFDPEVVISGEPALTQYVAEMTGRIRVLDYVCEATLQFERMKQLADSTKERLQWSLRKMKYAAFLRRVAPHYDLCIVNSIEDRDALLKASHGWKRVLLVPNGLELELYPNGDETPQSGTMIYPGSPAYSPNLDAVNYMARSILPRVRAAVPHAELRVTGGVPDDLDVPRGDGIRYTGYVPDVKLEIARSWLSAVPLRLGAGGTRFKVLETLALGTPLVSTEIGIEGVRVTDGEDVLLGEDPELFARHAIEVLRSESLRERLSTGGRRLIEEHYDWSVLGKDVTDALDELASARRGRIGQIAG